MRSLTEPLRKNKNLRTIGFDDAPFEKGTTDPVNVSGIVCSKTRFEGMLWDKLTHDGLDATEVIARMVRSSKFHEQLNAVLLDGLTFAGFNVVDLEKLAQELQLPCIAVMRTMPDLDAFYLAMQNVDQIEIRRERIDRAGAIHSREPFHYQVQGCSAEQAYQVLSRVTDTGHVPEPLRLAHLIGAAIKFGSSGKRA